MNAEQLGETTLDPRNRTLVQMLYSDQVEENPNTLRLLPEFDDKGNPTPNENPETMDENTFNALMGPLSETRKLFISANTTFSL